MDATKNITGIKPTQVESATNPLDLQGESPTYTEFDHMDLNLDLLRGTAMLLQ